MSPEGENVYSRILIEVFHRHYREDFESFVFHRNELSEVAAELGLAVPSNIGDVLYTFRYRHPLPDEIARTARTNCEWIIEGAGRSKYEFKQVKQVRIEPRSDLLAIKVPDATPSIILGYALDDEQALLAKIRYNRLVDVFWVL